MADTTKNLLLVVKGETQSAVRSFDDIKTSVESAGAKVSSFKEIIDTATGKVRQYITVISESVDVLQQVALAQKAVGTETGKVTSAIISQSAAIVKANKDTSDSEKDKTRIILEEAKKRSSALYGLTSSGGQGQQSNLSTPVESRGYTQYSQGTVAENRANRARQQLEDWKLVEQGLNKRLQLEEQKTNELLSIYDKRAAQLAAEATKELKIKEDEYNLVQKALNKRIQLEEAKAKELQNIANRLQEYKLNAQAEYARQALKIPDTRSNDLTVLKQDIQERTILKQKEFDLVEKALAATNARQTALAAEREAALLKIQENSFTQQQRIQSAFTSFSANQLINETSTLERNRRRSDATSAFMTLPSSEEETRLQEQELQRRQRLIEEIRRAEIAAYAEQARRQQAAYNQSAALFSQQTNQEVEELNRRIALETSIRRTGITSQQTIALQGAQEELRIRERLAAQLAVIESRIRTGGITPDQGVAARVIATTQYTQAMTANSIALDENARYAGQNSQVHQNMATRILEIMGIYRIYNTVINTVTNSLQAIPRIGIQLESTFASLSATIGTTAGANSGLAAITREAERTGLTISGLRESFKNFQASTSLAGESLNSTWRMFTNINTVATTLHLTTDQTSGVFLALAQIFNKTKVQSEELVKQLGNLLPGAFASFAKANSDMFTSSADLIAKMKAGTVLAHDTIENFTEYLADRFSKGFAAASEGLNANIGRMQNSFTLLGEAIYNADKGPLIAIVKSITSLTNAITTDINGVNKLGNSLKLLAEGGFGVLIAAIARYVSQITVAYTETTALGVAMATTRVSIYTTTGALAALEGAMAFLASPAVIIAGIVAIGSHLYGLKTASDEAKTSVAKFLEDFNKVKQVQTAEAKINIAADKDEIVIATKNALKTVDTTIAEEEAKGKGRSLLGKFAVKTGLMDSSVSEELKTAYKQREELEKNLTTARETAVEKIRLESETNNLSAKIENSKKEKEITLDAQEALAVSVEDKIKVAQERKRVLYEQDLATYEATLNKAKQHEDDLALVGPVPPKVARRIEEYTPPSTEALQEATQKVQEINTIIAHAGDALAAKSDKKAGIEALKDARVEYKDLSGNIKIAVETTKAALASLDVAYGKNAVSIAKYFSEKQRLQLLEIAKEKEIYQQQLDIAKGVGDKSKVAELQDKLKQLDQTARQIPDLISIDKQKRLELYNKDLQETHIKYLELIGDTQGAAKLKLQLTDDIKIKQFEQITKDVENYTAAEREAAKAAMSEEVALKASAGTMQLLNDLANKRAEINNVYSQEMQLLNVKIQTGQESQWSGLLKSRDLQAQKIKALKEEIDLVDKRLAQGDREAKLNPAEAKRLKEAKIEYETLVAEGDAVSNHFKTVVGDAMQSSMEGLILGTQNAKQAFTSFATSIVQDIAKIVASEIRSKIIGQLFSAAGSALSGAFSNVFSSNPFNGTGPLKSFQNNALGGMYSGAGISAYSGTVVSKPTIFPFASGIGLMGEAGAEAILPLKRGADGKLGVGASTNNSVQNGGNVYNISVTVQADKNTTPADTGQKVADAIMRSIAKDEIYKAQRPGNLLNRTTKFG